MKFARIFNLLLFVGVAIGLSMTVVASPQKLQSRADRIMARFVKNTRALRSFQGTLEVQTHSLTYSPPIVRSEKVRIAYAGPRRIAIKELSFATKGVDYKDRNQVALVIPHYYNHIVADGRRYYVLNTDKNKYILHPLHAKGVGVESQGAGIFSDFTLGDALLSASDPQSRMVFTGGRVVGEQSMDSVLCDKIQFSQASDGLPEPWRTTYWIGRGDGLLRRVELKSQRMLIVENYSIRQINKAIPVTEFAIKPPKTAKRVQEF